MIGRQTVFFLSAFVGGLMSCSEPPEEASNKPNVILILTDDQGWGATSVKMDDRVQESASDFVRTPNLERLAAIGMRFSNGYAPHPNCSPSRASIQTGKSPAKLKFTDICDRNSGDLYEGNRLIPPQHINELPEEEVTIAELIKEHQPEYATAHFGKWHMKGGGPALHGYDASDGATTNREGSSKDPLDPKLIFSVTQKSSAWIEEQVNAGNPFFLQISHYATHLPMQSLESTRSQLESVPKGQRHHLIPHAAMAEDLDTGVGMILDKVGDLGIAENTFIIYLADNGTYPTDNPGNINGPLHGWKATVWEGGIRVPFIISGPGIKGNSITHERVVGWDLYPTICDWLDIDSLPPGLEGGSLVPLLESGGEARVKRSRDFMVFHWPHYQLQKGSQPESVLYRGSLKLHKFYESGDLRLFDLSPDLAETQDLSEKNAEATHELHELLTGYLKEIDAQMPVQNEQYSTEKDPGAKHEALKLALLEDPYPEAQ